VAVGDAISGPNQCWDWSVSAIEWHLGFAPPAAWVPAISIRLLLCALIVLGAVVMAYRGLWFIPLCFCTSSLLIVVVPWTHQFARYLTPMVPFMAVFLTFGMSFIAEKARRAARFWEVAAQAIGVLLICSLFAEDLFWILRSFGRDSMVVVYRDAQGGGHVYRMPRYTPDYAALDDSFEWVHQHADPDDVIATTLPHTAYVRLGLKSVLPPLVTDPAEARRLLDAVPVRFVILDSLQPPDLSPRYAEPAVRTDASRWRLAYTAPGPGRSEVYERVRP
jgi:hypothetical protein